MTSSDTSTAQCRHVLLISGAVVSLLALIIAGVTFLYVSGERFFYCWDYSGYQDLTIDLATSFRDSPTEAVDRVRRSLGDDYPQVVIVPLVPFMLAAGGHESRMVYVQSLALMYLLPFTLVMGAIAVTLLPLCPRWVLGSTAALTLLIPMAWVPTLRGYPDTAGALLIALAVLIYVQDIDLKHWWRVPLIGFLVAAAMLLRRHFAYSGIAFMMAVALQAVITFLVQVRQHGRRALSDVLSSALRIGLMGTSALVTLAVLGWAFVQNVLGHDFAGLYASYARSLPQNLWYYGSSYGWLVCVLAGLGLCVGLLVGPLAHREGVFIALFASLSLIQWAAVVGQLNVHYTLHFTIFVVLGLAAFIWTAWTKLGGQVRVLVLGATFGFLAVNLVIGLAPVNVPFGPLFSANHRPLVRRDYSEVARLVAYLRRVASQGDPIYVAASSGLMNDSILRSAEGALHGRDNRVLNVMFTPHVDSRDSYPLEMLLQARYVIVTIPFQHHLPAEEQDVVRVVFDAFSENWEIAQDFVRLPVQFSLDEGAVANIYRRAQATSVGTAVRTLRTMQNRIAERPGTQLDWIILSEVVGSSIRENPDSTYYVRADMRFCDTAPVASFLYLGTLPTWLRVTGRVSLQDKDSADAVLRFATLNEKGEITDTSMIEVHPPHSSAFSVSFRQEDAVYLLLQMSINDQNDSLDTCSLAIRDLAVSSLPRADAPRKPSRTTMLAREGGY